MKPPGTRRAWRRANWLRVGAPMRLAPVDAWNFIDGWIWGPHDLSDLASMQLDGLSIDDLPHAPKPHGPRRRKP